ncbi:hypothetical protein R1flu_022455 [Riccia fluitans]|uniref:Uncharacterized protein n=1 Tax=Riccia fluitans TaxID=41844 RepID=A0ABD1XP83_9MARC
MPKLGKSDYASGSNSPLDTDTDINGDQGKLAPAEGATILSFTSKRGTSEGHESSRPDLSARPLAPTPNLPIVLPSLPTLYLSPDGVANKELGPPPTQTQTLKNDDSRTLDTDGSTRHNYSKEGPSAPELPARPHTNCDPSIAPKLNKRKKGYSPPSPRDAPTESAKRRRHLLASLGAEGKTLEADHSGSTKSPLETRNRPKSRSKMQAKGKMSGTATEKHPHSRPQRGQAASGRNGGGAALLLHHLITLKDSGRLPDGSLTWAQANYQGHSLHVAVMYGPHTPGYRTQFWKRLSLILPFHKWIFLGDWNSVERADQTFGHKNLMIGEEQQNFRSLKLKFALSDAYDVAKERKGPCYTRHIAYGVEFRWAALDRIYLPTDAPWFEAIESINHQAKYALSDHMPVSVSLALGGRLPRGIKLRTYFKFDAHLMALPEINRRLRDLWEQETKQVEDPVKAYCKGWAIMRDYMKVKQREQNTHISQIDELGTRLKACHENLSLHPSDELKTEILQLEIEKRKREHARDRLVRIWSRARYVAQGDAPTKYFLSLHRKQVVQHHFSKLKLLDGSTTTCKTAIMKEATRAFSKLFASENRTKESRRDTFFVNSKLTNKVSEAQRKRLADLPTMTEIQEALDSFPKGKAPGIDGTNVESLQAVWDFVGPAYLKMMQFFWLKPLTFGSSAVADFSLFADDMGIYMEIDQSSFAILRGILAFFESASGARLNLQKSSSLIIGLHIDPPPWLRHLGCIIMEHNRAYRYLGALIGSGFKHDQLISFCLDCMIARLNLWSNRLLSFEARAIFIKHVLLSIPIFYLSAIGITKKVAETIEKIAAHFLWGKTEDGKHKRSLIPWQALKRGKCFGGLGFKDVWRQGLALFSKHMGEFFADSSNAQWHNLLHAFIDGQRAKRSGSIIRGTYTSQELLLLKRPLYPGKSYMTKSLLSA